MNNYNNINKWQSLIIKQQPDWSDNKVLSVVLNKLKTYPNLVFPYEINLLKQDLINASKGKSFIIQGGDCAETFIDFSAKMVKNKIKILLQMSAIIKYITKLDIINIGRIAGQFSKPRSNKFEERDGLSLPSYRGDAVNDINFDRGSRKSNPNRLLMAYNQSAATMNLIRSLIMDGYTDFKNIQSWGLSFLENSHYVKKYNNIAKNIKDILKFTDHDSIENFYSQISHMSNSIYTSHECLLLDYENSFIKHQKNENKYYSGSAHMLWVGDRTRNVNEAHVEFISNLENPIGIKIGPSINLDDIILLCKKLNPKNELGKLVFINRLGVNYVSDLLPKIVKIIKNNDLNIIWMCDPMHGNTITSKTGYKTRNFNTIKEELEIFFKICYENNVIPAGVHFELTGENVTECTGGMKNIQDIDLNQYYQTACDPRLNNEQSLEMAFLISDYINKGENLNE